jgi:hypothetical protein
VSVQEIVRGRSQRPSRWNSAVGCIGFSSREGADGWVNVQFGACDGELNVCYWHLADIAADFEHVRFQGIKRALEFAVESYLLIGCHCLRGRAMMAVALSTSSYPSSQSH